MLERLASNWWILALRGLLGIVIAVFAFARPLATVAALVILFGAYVLVDGIFAVVSAFGSRTGNDRWWLLLDGLAGILAGLVALFYPGLAAATLVILFGVWAVVSGVCEIVEAVRTRKDIENEWMLAASGVLSVVLGIALLLMPVIGMVASAWTIGVYALLSGLFMLLVAFRLRSLGKRVGRAEPA